MQVSLIIAAGGKGTRFRRQGTNLSERSRLPSKLFYLLQGLTLLERSVSCFQKIPEISETILVVPRESRETVRRMIRKHGWRGIKLAPGGRTRAESVKQGLEKSDSTNPWVMVHDGARPFVSSELVKRLFEESSRADGILLGKRVVPTIKKVNEDGLIQETLDRNVLMEAETPQLVRRELLERAYQENPEALEATDEASLIESVGGRVKVTAHEGWNPKITTFEDLRIAEAYLGGGAAGEIKIGFGKDLHRLVGKRPFRLGGVRIPFSKGALGHSDGDALLHAISDAILGALGAGDIGEWFSDKDSKNKNLASSKILETVNQEALRRGWCVGHLDTVIDLEKPKLGPYKTKMRKRIAEILKIKPEAVSIKAKTMEGLGPIGEGRAVSAEAVVLIKRSAS